LVAHLIGILDCVTRHCFLWFSSVD